MTHDKRQLQDMAEGNALFSGLRKLIFKDEPAANNAAPVVPPPPTPEKAPRFPENATVPSPAPSPLSWQPDSSGEGDDTTRAKAYQLLESINQPGVDFLEVWNAASENGGPAGLRSAFNTLKYADKTLTREKVITTGRYYIDALQKALQADLERKAAQQRDLQEEKTRQRESLGKEAADMEKQISELQNRLIQKREALAEMDSRYEPRLRELQQKMDSGKRTIEGMLQQMQAILQAAEREL